MKKLIYIMVFGSGIFFSSCKKENTPAIILNEIPDSTAIPQATGSFNNGPYGSVSGQAKIILTGTKYELKLMDFSSSNGPDLRVYLSTEMNAVNIIDLGPLKATGGNQLYSITVPVNFAQYKYALIHCRQFNHLFGWALMR